MKYVLNLSEDQSAALIALLTAVQDDDKYQHDNELLIDEVIGALLAPTPTSSGGDLSRRVEHLLLSTTMSYADIVATVREEFPMANTSTKSVASVACTMRKKGQPVPLRLKLNHVAA